MTSPHDRFSLDRCFPGDSEMSRRMRALDWSKTDVGAPQDWPDNLRLAVSLCLTSRIPIVVYWGPNHTVLYNDAYISFLGQTKHPHFLGQPGRECWQEIWETIGPMLKSVHETGEATWSEDVLMFFARRRPLEEVYVRFTFGPILAADGRTVEGIFCPCTETTEQVVGARRLETLRKLGASVAEAHGVEATCREIIGALAENPLDIAFANLYITDEAGTEARLHTAANPLQDAPQLPLKVSIADSNPAIWPLASALRSQQPTEVDLGALSPACSGRAWPDPLQQALVLPIRASTPDRLAGLLVVGVSPRRELDDSYRTFFNLVAGHIAAAIADARAYEDEHRRAEAFAELDRVKTEFFNNISHEFRTPLTLLLGPLEETLAHRDGLSAEDRERLVMAHRNSLRLLRLVNTLLDFSRLEAGRIRAKYEPTDLAVLTAELASIFRSAIERAGLRLSVNCPPLCQPVYIDHEMWEKIVLNLLSNALKFTFEGEIEVSLRPAGEMVELMVGDTGTGIPPEEIPHLFDRFHRVSGTRGRTIEGSGIGLALVQELAKMHGGFVSVESRIDCGSRFTVSIPLGKAHLPAELVSTQSRNAVSGVTTTAGTSTFLEEALRWLPETLTSDLGASNQAHASDGASTVERHPPSAVRQPQSRILVADDNADMRDYLQRLLAQNDYQVLAVADGQAALEVWQEYKPDLILSDVMMPRLDGFGLIRKLRDDERVSEVPVILLSARAGEEARIEGMETGADDYLVKPFSAKELLVRVKAHLELARVRREAAQVERQLRAEANATSQQLEEVLAGISDMFLALDHDWRCVFVNSRVIEATGLSKEEFLGNSIWELFPATVGTEFERALRRAMAGQVPVHFEYFYPDSNRWFENHAYPTSSGLTLFSTEFTERKQAEEAVRKSEGQLRLITDAVPALISYVDSECRYQFNNHAYMDWFGHTPSELRGKHMREVLGEEAYRAVLPSINAVLSGQPVSFEGTLNYMDGGPRFVRVNYIPDFGEQGEVRGYFALITDHSESKQAEEALRVSEARYRQLADAMPQLVWTCGADGVVDYYNSRLADYIEIEQSPDGRWQWHPLIHPDDAGPTLLAWQRAIESGEPYEFEHRLQMHDGRYCWHLSRARPAFDDNGNIIKWFGTATDIHEQKRAEEDLLKSAQRSSLLARLSDITRMLNDAREIAMASMQILREHLGADRCAWADADEDKNHLTILGDSVAPGLTGLAGRIPLAAFGPEVLRALFAGQTFSSSDTLIDLPGSADRRNYDATGIRALIATPIHKGDHFVAGTVVQMLSPRIWTQSEIEIVREVTERCHEALERARIERELRASEKRYRAVVNSQVEMLCRFQADGTILFVNTAYARVNGATPEELIGRNFWEFVAAQDRLAVKEMLNRLTPESPEIHIENRLERPEGEIWTLWINRGLVFDADGRLIEAQSSGIDITERKRMEEALKETDRRKDEFLAMLAHELRNPLAPIQSAAQVLKLVGSGDANQQWACKVIERQSQHLTRLVDDLLDVSRITRGKVTLQRETLELTTIITRAIETSRPLIVERKHHLTVSLPDESVLLEGDLTRLVQVVGNLLNNAAKYTDEGGTIQIEAVQENSEVVIRVQDSGMGVAADLLPRVFDLFTQADRSLDRSQGGLGIGLTIVRNLVDLHGGKVEARSEGTGCGSEFIVRLPALVALAEATETRADDHPRPAIGGLRILVVEDNIDSAEMMKFMLQLDGHEVQIVLDGTAALEAARSIRPQAILCDIGLPGMNGYEVATLLRSLPEFSQTPLIALSGYGQEQDRLRSKEAGFDYHLIKPVEPDSLAALLGSLHLPGRQ